MRSTYSILALLALVLMLTACGRSGQSDGPVPEAAEVATAPEDPEGATAEPEQPSDAAAAVTIRVLREDGEGGVAATIGRLDDTDVEHHVVDVDDSGIARLDEPCNEEDRFAAKPRVAAYLRTAPQRCAQTITFRLYSAHATYQLIQIADERAKAGDLIVAQANYGLAADRLKYAKPAESARLTVLANAAAGRILGVQTPTTTQDGKETVSGEMVEKLKLYQNAAQLPESGVLDAATREAISKIPPSQVLRRAVDSTADASTPAPQASTMNVAAVRAVDLSPATKTEASAIRNRIDKVAVQR
jgi:hypothetical protein